MNNFLLYNGHFYKNEEPLINADNRGLRYGDGLFETFRVVNGVIHLADLHFERLFKGLESLQFVCPVHFTAEQLAKQVASLCKKNGHLAAARVRITIVRGSGGVYDPENHLPNCIIQSWALPSSEFELNENGLVTGIYYDAHKQMDAFSNLKSNNYLPYTMAALHAKKQRWNEVFVLNAAKRICDASIGNVFIVKNQTIYTCPLSEGCVAGVMRQWLLQNLPVNGFSLQEKEISIDDVLSADEVFVTNVIRGMRWVQACASSSYTNRFSIQIFNALFKK